MFRRLIAYLSEKDPAQGRYNAEVARSIKELQDQVILGGTIITDQALTASTTLVTHKLGRVPRGWIVLGRNAAQVIYDNQDPDKDFLYLRAGGNVTATIYVF